MDCFARFDEKRCVYCSYKNSCREDIMKKNLNNLKKCYGLYSPYDMNCNKCETKLECAKSKKDKVNKKVDNIMKSLCFGFYNTEDTSCVRCNRKDDCLLRTVKDDNLNKPQVSLLTGHHIPKPIVESKDIEKISKVNNYRINVKSFHLSEEGKVNNFLDNLDPLDINEIKIDSGFYVIIYKKRGY